MAVSDGSETKEDWVMDSLDRYERLHVFELQEPTLCMEWSQDNTAIYVAGFSHEKHNELVQLLLPEKLLAADKQTLLARRDFKIGRGAISKQPVYHIQCLKNEVITSGLGPEITVWGHDSGSPDLLVATGNITTPTPTLSDPTKTELQISLSHAQPHCLLTGSSLNTLQLLDVHTFQQSWQSIGLADAMLYGLDWLPGETRVFLTCSGLGELTMWDSRQSAGRGALNFSTEPLSRNVTSEEPPTVQYSMAVCGSKCVSLSATGEVVLYDTRGPSRQPLATSQLPTATTKSFLQWNSHTAGHKVLTRPCVKFSESSNQMSVSGLDRGVVVYDITSWSNDIISPAPVFIHAGHEADSPQCRVTVHSWHPSFHSMILSCDSEGIMHAWEWQNEN